MRGGKTTPPGPRHARARAFISSEAPCMMCRSDCSGRRENLVDCDEKHGRLAVSHATDQAASGGRGRLAWDAEQLGRGACFAHMLGPELRSLPC